MPGYTCRIDYSTNLADTNAWTFLTNLTLIEPVEIWVDTSVDTHASGVARRSYRVTAP